MWSIYDHWIDSYKHYNTDEIGWSEDQRTDEQDYMEKENLSNSELTDALSQLPLQILPLSFLIPHRGQGEESGGPEHLCGGSQVGRVLYTSKLLIWPCKGYSASAPYSKMAARSVCLCQTLTFEILCLVCGPHVNVDTPEMQSPLSQFPHCSTWEKDGGWVCDDLL